MTGTKPKEREYYDIVKAKFERLFATKYAGKIREIHLEVTAGGKFSNKLKARIPPGRDIIFAFLKSSRAVISLRPDAVRTDLKVLFTKIDAAHTDAWNKRATASLRQ